MCIHLYLALSISLSFSFNGSRNRSFALVIDRTRSIGMLCSSVISLSMVVRPLKMSLYRHRYHWRAMYRSLVTCIYRCRCLRIYIAFALYIFVIYVYVCIDYPLYICIYACM